MLINERYCGDKLLQKKFTTDEFPFHLVMNKGELPQYYVYDSFPKIIERSLYEASYAKWERNRDVNGKIKITKKVGLTITTYGNDKLPTGYLF